MICYDLRNIRFSYNKKSKGDTLSIDHLSLNHGEKVFIHGPSGSGKSTLLNLLSGILVPDEGEINVLEQRFDEMSLSKRDQFRGDHIGYIFQSFNLIPYLSVYENISLPQMSSKVKRGQIKDLDLEIRELCKSLGLSELIHRGVSKLSIGQQQRVAAARALLGNPQIVIADEPTSSLDSDVTGDFLNLLFTHQRKLGFTLIFVSHDKSLKDHFDSVISLSEINNVGGQGA